MTITNMIVKNVHARNKCLKIKKITFQITLEKILLIFLFDDTI